MRHTDGKEPLALVSEGTVTVMAAADPDGPGLDLYQLLGVPREASREDIAQAWRRRARAEHPDSRPGDASDPAQLSGAMMQQRIDQRVFLMPCRRMHHETSRFFHHR